LAKNKSYFALKLRRNELRRIYAPAVLRSKTHDPCRFALGPKRTSQNETQGSPLRYETRGSSLRYERLVLGDWGVNLFPIVECRLSILIADSFDHCSGQVRGFFEIVKREDFDWVPCCGPE
jgi:hypothetical protein